MARIPLTLHELKGHFLFGIFLILISQELLHIEPAIMCTYEFESARSLFMQFKLYSQM